LKIAFNISLTKTFIAFIALIFFARDAKSQFYNGHQMDFGKSRVQYIDFYWQYYRFKKFDTYFYVGGNELAQQISIIADRKIKSIEKMFDYALDKRIIFIVYNKHSDFKQSNIGLVTENDQYNIGGVTQISGNKVFIFNEGDFNKLEKQVNAAIAEVVITEMLYGSDFKDKVANSTLLSLPDWYTKGLISFVSEEWSFETENMVRDGIISGKYEKFSNLQGVDAVYAGHSLWYYVATKYGKSVIPNIVYLTRVSKNVESGFLFVIGTTLKYLSYDWLTHYDQMFYDADQKRTMPPEESRINKKYKKNRVYKNPKISPDSKYLVYTTNIYGKYILWLYNTETKKHKRIIRREHKLDQLTDYSYPVVAWHPTGSLFTFITEEKGKIMLTFYIMETGKLETKEVFNFEKVLDMSYSQSGKYLIFSAVKNGYTDLYLYTVSSNTAEQLTDDIADDHSPRFINDSKQIVFSSNRLNDTIVFKNYRQSSMGKNDDIFIYDFETRNPVLKRFTTTPYINESQPFQLKNDVFTYLSDENGIVNRYVAVYDSAISYIDTATHYYYYSRPHPVTNFKRNILDQDVNAASGSVAQIIYHNGKYKLFSSDLTTEKNSYSGKFFNTSFRRKITDNYKKADSLTLIKKDSLQLINKKFEELLKLKTDSSFNDTIIDINNFIFELERLKLSTLNTPRDTNSVNLQNDNPAFPKQLIYFTSFYPNQFVSQFDFGFLNASYQAFTGNAVYFNPGMNMLFKIGAQDLFEDYRITGGIRLAGNFESNEYLLSAENLKKRFDKQMVFHRQGFTNLVNNYYYKTISHELFFITKYPFSQVSKIKGTASLRHDKISVLSSEYFPLNAEGSFKIWGGVKLEYIFDNSRSLGYNLNTGTKFKVFGEIYKQINESESDLLVLGMDYRHYIKLHKCLIWANRFASSLSYGSSKLIYYLGSVDNWINLSPRVEKFNLGIPINDKVNYVYQTLATNLRGFTQNIRNGTHFAVINSELRWPIVKYFANKPINSDFLENFQVIGFFDIGSAWSGSSPNSDENAYQTQTISTPPVTVIIDRDRDPVVFGYGFGVRTRLLGYFVRADWAWGVENSTILDGIFYLSLSQDF